MLVSVGWIDCDNVQHVSGYFTYSKKNSSSRKSNSFVSDRPSRRLPKCVPKSNLNVKLSESYVRIFKTITFWLFFTKLVFYHDVLSNCNIIKYIETYSCPRAFSFTIACGDCPPISQNTVSCQIATDSDWKSKIRGRMLMTRLGSGNGVLVKCAIKSGCGGTSHGVSSQATCASKSSLGDGLSSKSLDLVDC